MRVSRTFATVAVAVLAAAGAGRVDGGAERADPKASAAPRVALVVHGGAGTIRRGELPAEVETAYRQALAEALGRGHRILADGGAALDAVEATLRFLEDSPLFNAGRGAVFTADGTNELDASIMEGSSRRAGAVAGVTTVRNPISLARAVMERTPHVLLAGAGADALARELGLETAAPEYFWTERRWQSLERARERRREAGDDGEPRRDSDGSSASHHGTVGAVALDRAGTIAAGTSTGGMTMKRRGRVGDSPLVGAGTYADDRCGVSATGHGEYFIRWAVAYDICARSRYRGETVAEAARSVIHRTLAGAGGTGGVIALDAEGRPALEFNTDGMFRGWIDGDGTPRTAMYADE